MPNAILIALGKAKHSMKGKEEEPSERDIGHYGESEEGDGDELSCDEDEMMAAKEAFEAKDAETYAKALKAFFRLCMLKHEEDEESLLKEETEEEGY